MTTAPWMAIASALTLGMAAAPATAQGTPSRGELLYDTHCVACHDARVHWRDQKLATDWTTLRALVRQWQGTAQLQWSDADIDEVARHLNDRVYRFARPVQPAG